MSSQNQILRIQKMDYQNKEKVENTKGMGQKQQTESCYKPFEQNIKKVGFAIFTSSIKKRQYLRLINGDVLETLEKDIWCFKGHDANKKQRWQKIFQLMKEAHIKEFQYSPTINHSIVKQIQPILFPQLKELNLFQAQIENYESFTFLNVPNLEKINLIYNNCANFKSFNKAHIPSMKTICIYLKSRGQLILGERRRLQYFSIQDFERWGFELNQLRLQKSRLDSITLQDLSKLAKAKPSLQNVYICPRNRVKQNKVIRKLKGERRITFMYHKEIENQFQEYQGAFPTNND